MSGTRGVVLVAGRELHQAFRSKSFWIVVAVLFIGSSAAMIVPELLKDDRPHYKVAVVDASPTFTSTIAAGAKALKARIDLVKVTTPSEARHAIEVGDANVAVVAEPRPAVVVKSIKVDRLVGLVQQALGIDAVVAKLQAAGLSTREIGQALNTPLARVEHLNSGEAERTRRGTAAGVAFALYVLLFSLMTQVANGTATEKANRISEVLLSIVRPGTLLSGKVIGVGMIGLLTLLAGIVPIVTKALLGGTMPAGIGPAVAGGAAWYLLGIALFLIVAAALGALVERPEEAGSAVIPLSMTLIGSMIVANTAADSPISQVFAVLPLTSTLVMPARIAIGAASPVEMAASLAVLVLSVVIAARVSSTVYKGAIVRTGRRLKLREVLQSA